MIENPLPPADATTAPLPFDVESVTTARKLITDQLTNLNAPRRVLEDANLVVGELVMNGICHGQPHKDGTITVAWWFPGHDALRFTVCDGGNVEKLEPRMPDPLTPGGRGLAIIDRLCRAWTYDTAEGTRITCDIPLD